MDEFDVLIAGGGMVGASLARALAGTGLRIGVVEAVDPAAAAPQPSYDERVIALSWGSRLILQAIGCWDGLATEAEPILGVHISDRGRFGFARLDHREQGVAALGYVAGARALGGALLDGIREQANLEWICPARLADFRVEDAAVEATLAVAGDRSRRVRARLLVAADGGDSPVRHALGVPVREWQYGQSAVIANLTPGIPHGGTAYERFTDSGPLALLPMTGGRCSLVWTARDAEVDGILALDDAAFLARLQDRFGYRLGRLGQVGRRSAYPLRLRQARELVRPRVALVGNAAHTLHPIAGQGFNLGLRDVAALAEVLAEAQARREDPGMLAVLERYAAWQRADQGRVALVTDLLARLFVNPLAPVGLARDLGLLGLDLIPPARRALTRQFMGLRGRLPRLALGLPLRKGEGVPWTSM